MAQALKFGKGVWATKTGSSMAYNDQNDNYKPLPFNVERDSIATRVNKEGLIEVVGHDKLRIDYTDTDKGVALLENSSTNLIPYSNFDDGWELSNSTKTLNSSTSPEGNLNAVSLKSSTSSSNEKYIRRFVGVSASTDYTFSVFAKKNELSEIRLSSTGNSNAFAFFNLSNGTIESVGSSATAKIENFGNGWFRCSIKHQNSITGIFSVINLSIDGSVNISTNVNDGVYLFGSQYEQSSYTTSYIPTSGSTVQRAADVANNAGNSEVFNDSEGVLYANIISIANTGVSGSVFLKDSSGNNRIQIVLRGTGWVTSYYQKSGGSSFAIDSNYLNYKQFNKASIKYSSSEFSFWVNGFKIYSVSGDYSFNTNTFNNISFDLNTTESVFGKTKELGYYDEILTDAELETLTSYRSLSELVTELNLNTL